MPVAEPVHSYAEVLRFDTFLASPRHETRPLDEVAPETCRRESKLSALGFR
ncbi:MAG: hypothetical protein ACYCW6_18310 [Candidatus Xenobia bacterium]